MKFIELLKRKGQQIIELGSQLGERVHTWDQEESAPPNGYTDRAGFIVYDDIELFTDVYSDDSKSLLRTRLAWSPKSEDDHSSFTIITLDFSTKSEKAKSIIEDSDNLTPQELVSLLKDPLTVPELIQVSLESGTNSTGQKIGKRYEFTKDELADLSDEVKGEFIATLNEAYDQIVLKI